MRDPVVLVVAKAPVPGRVKTRLAVRVGPETAARLAAAAILDTVAACEAAFGQDHCYLALDGDLADGLDGDGLSTALAGWTILAQHGDGFAARLTSAHFDVAGLAAAPVVQVGMDTPQATAADLDAVREQIRTGADAVLGPAVDGGWWVLALSRPELAEALSGVQMSSAQTGADTRVALEAAGAVVSIGPTLRDVDDAEDAAQVAWEFPRTGFARCWDKLVVAAGNVP